MTAGAAALTASADAMALASSSRRGPHGPQAPTPRGP
jgi:hypothetical protein